MSDIALHQPRIPSMSAESIGKVRALENLLMTLPQADVLTSHVFHGGMYARTVCIPAGAVMTGALIKIDTLLIVCGDVTVFIGEEAIELRGHNVLAASAGRKQAFHAHTDTYLTMVFPSSAMSVADAEAEFTDEGHILLSRQNDNHVTIGA